MELNILESLYTALCSLSVEVVYLKGSLSNRMKEMRGSIRTVFSADIVMPDGSIAEYMNDRSLNTVILDFSTAEILSNEDHFELFVKNMQSREPTEPLIKEYYYGGWRVGWNLNEISKEYNKRVGRYISPKPANVVQSCFATLFAKATEVNLVVYVGVFLDAIQSGRISEESLDVMFGKSMGYENLKEEGTVFRKLVNELRFIKQSYNFVFELLEKIEGISEMATDVLRKVSEGKIDNIILLRNSYMKIFKNIKKRPDFKLLVREYDEATVFARILNRSFDAVELFGYAKNLSHILNPGMNGLMTQLQREGIDLTSGSGLNKDPNGLSMLQSLLNIVSYNKTKNNEKNLEILYLKADGEAN